MKSNLSEWHEFDHSERNSAEMRVTPTGSIEVFHRSLIKCYDDVNIFCLELQVQNYDRREMNRRFLSIFDELNTLMQRSDVHYWLARAYAERHKRKSRNSLFVSFHLYALEEAWREFGHFVHAIHHWAVVSCIVPGYSGALKNVIDAAAAFARGMKTATLPDLDKRYRRKLQSEVKLACELLDGHPKDWPKTEAATTKQKRSPEPVKKRISAPGDADARILAALCKYHKYKDDGDKNLEPLTTDELAELAGVAGGSVTGFWKRRFGTKDREGSYKDYVRACQSNSMQLNLAIWSGEVPSGKVVELIEGRFTGKLNKDYD